MSSLRRRSLGRYRVVVLGVVVWFSLSSAQAKYGGGSGAKANPYQIWTPEHMQEIGANHQDWKKKHFKLMADIDLSSYPGATFNIIGRYIVAGDPGNRPFTGVFDGNGHTISNFTYETSGGHCIGLFAYISGEEAEIKDLTLIDPNISAATLKYVAGLVAYMEYGTLNGCHVENATILGDECVGGLVGETYGDVTIVDCNSTGNISGGRHVGGIAGYCRQGSGGTVSNCHSSCSVSGGGSMGGLFGYSVEMGIVGCSATGEVSAVAVAVGGLVGYNDAGNISRSCSTVDVIGGPVVGGLVGENYGGNISESYSTGAIIGDYQVGGLVGNMPTGSISNSYSTGSVSGSHTVGGLVGINHGSVANSYSAGAVSGGVDFGGLAGYAHQGEAVNCFWDIEASGQIESAGGKGMMTAEMQIAETFISWGGCGNAGIWTIEEGVDYPRLWWENKPGALLPAYQLSDFVSGSGEPNDPYLIYTSAELSLVGQFYCEWGDSFKLMGDIDLGGYTGTSFDTVGVGQYYFFSGIFEGNGHTISNFTYEGHGINNAGFFGYINDANAEIRNLGLIDPNVNMEDAYNLGGLVGRLQRGRVSNCYVETGIVRGGTGYYIGGLVGAIEEGSVFSSYYMGHVSGYRSVGGLVGRNGNGSIFDSYSIGSVSGTIYVGGLLGYNSPYATGISNCYASGPVDGVSEVGGLVGYHWGVSYTKCFWDSDVNPDVNGIGNTTDPNVVGLPTVEMQVPNTFISAGWDFVGEGTNGPNDIWRLCNEGAEYPQLNFQFPAGDFVCPDGVSLVDFSVLGAAWYSDPNLPNWNPICDISDPNNNFIDESDLKVFVDIWLKGF